MAENRAEGIVNHGDGLQMRFDGPVNVISGNHNIVQNPMQTATDKVNSTSEDHEPVPDPSSSLLPHRILSKKMHIRRFKCLINEFSREKTFVKVTENYEGENLREPQDVVYPRMRKGIRFYNGEYAHEEGFSVTAPAHRGEIITPRDLVDMITTGEGPGYIAIVGQAGSGKTTTMKRIARSVMVASDISENPNSWYEMFTNLFQNQKRRYKMLYFLSVKDIPNVPSVGVGELLFDKSLPEGVSNHVLKYGYSWITQNQSKVIIFLDGLDQAAWAFDDTCRSIGLWDRASTATIMQNLLSLRILPDVKLVVSSREHAVATLPYELRPTNIVALAGLDHRDVEKLFVSIVGIGGKEAWNELTKTSPIFIRLSSVPLYLIFNTIVWIHCKRKELTPPDSITGVMLAILSIIPRSSHLLVRNRATEMMQNMKGLAFNATKAKKLTFCIDDLQRYGLDASETSHLIIGVPKETLLCHHLMEGEDYIFFFSHQTLQEIFSALFLADMKGSELKQFVSDENGLHSNHWSVVRRMLCGILFNPDVKKYISSGFLRVDQQEFQAKQEIIRSSLQEQINCTLTEYQRLELYGALYEANDADLIESSVREIEFSNVEFPPDGMHTLSSIMRRCRYLAILRLVKCGLDKEMLDILGSNTAGLKLQVDVLDISGNSMDKDAILAFNIALENFNVGELIMGNCSLSTSTLEDLTIKNTRVWNLMSFDSMDFELFYAIGKAATKGRLEEVRMTPWKHWVANRDQVKKLSKLQVLGQVEVLETDLAGDITETTEDISLFKKRCKIKEIKARLSGRIIASSEAIFSMARWQVTGEVDILETELTGDITKITSEISSMKNHCQIKEIRTRLSGNIAASKKAISIAAGWKISGEVDILEIELTGNVTETILKIPSIEKRCRIKEVRAHLSGNIAGTWKAILVASQWQISGKVEVLQMELTGDVTKAISAKISLKERFHAGSVKFRLSGKIASDQETISILANENIIGQVHSLKTQLEGDITESVNQISSIEKRCQIKEVGAHLSRKIAASSEAIFTLKKWRISGEVDLMEIKLTGTVTETISNISSIEKRCRIKVVRAHLSGNIAGTWEAISAASRWEISGEVEELQMELTGDPRNGISAKTSINERFQAKSVIFRLSGIITSNQETISILAKEIISGQIDILETELTRDITETAVEISLIEKRCQIKEIKARLSGRIIASSKAISTMARWKISGEVDILETELTGDISKITSDLSSMMNHCQIKEIRARLSANITASKESISIAAGWNISGEVDILEIELTKNVTETISEISSIEKRCRIKEVKAHLSGNIVGTWEAISVSSRWKISGKVNELQMELTGEPMSAISAKTSVKKRFHAERVKFRLSGIITPNQGAISRLAKENIIGQVDVLETKLTGDITETTEEISLIEKRCQIKEIKARLSGRIIVNSESICTTARWKISGEVDILETELTGDITKITSEISSMKNHCQIKEIRARLSGNITASKEAISIAAGWKISGEVDILEIELTENVTETISEISSIEKRCRIKEVKAHLSGNIMGTWEAICVASRWKISGKVDELQMELTGDPRSELSAKTSVKKRFNAGKMKLRLSGMMTSNQETMSRFAKENIIGQVDILETELTGDITNITLEISSIAKRSQIKEVRTRLSGNIKASMEAISIVAGWKISGEVDVLDTELKENPAQSLSEISLIENQCNIKSVRARFDGEIIENREWFLTDLTRSCSTEVFCGYE